MISISPYGEAPYTGKELYLNNIGTLFLLALLVIDSYKNVLSKIGFRGLFLFSIFHSIGSTWLYSFVPYNDWFIGLSGFDIDSYFEFTRNHYDRFVHFSFGGLFLPFLFEGFFNKYKNKILALLLAWLSLQCFSMFYEVFEWLLTVFMDPKIAEDYNGQQGDPFDAQKDMALAMMGSNLLVLFYLFKKDKS